MFYLCKQRENNFSSSTMAKIPINLKEGSVKNGEVIIGIDLGTTNSLVAHVVDGQPVAVRERDEYTLVPSIIHFREDGKILVGDEAKQLLISSPERTIYSVKRLMGKSYSDVSAQRNFFSYRIIDEDPDGLVKIRVGDNFYNPIELSSLILKRLKERIEHHLQKTVSKAVITVPAYFNDAQRQATRDAGRLAGLDVLRIVNEPTAASLAYGLDKTDLSQTVAVFDLGGGTFDISILSIHHGIFEVLSTHGDTFLGGDDFDQAIVNYWMKSLKTEADDLDASQKQQLRLLAEEAKKHLGIHHSFVGTVGDWQLALEQSQFLDLIQPLIDRTIQSCQRALSDANLLPSSIDHIILVGGSTRIPSVKNAVSHFFGKEVNDQLDPDEVVALGAAIQADILAGNRRDLLLLDVTPLSLGIETIGGLMDVILPRNSKIPSSVARNYTTSVDGQKNLKIAVFQGERDLVEHNRKLGEFVLRGIPPMAAGIPKIEIRFVIDADGILKVAAKELRSGTEQEIEIRSAYGLSEEEMAQMLLESIEHAQEDMAEKALLESINEANHVIKSTERFIIQNQTNFTEEVLQKLHSLKADLQHAIESKDKNLIEKQMDTLNQFATPLAHEAMDLTILEALKDRKV